MTRTSARRTVAALGIAAAVTGTTLVATPSAEAAGRITVTFRNGALTVAGNDSANLIEVLRAPDGRIVVDANSRVVRHGGTPTVRNIRSIKVSSYGGDDYVFLRIGPAVGGATVYAGDGNDHVSGGSGDDVLRGGAGKDTLFGNGGADLVLGDDGDDSVQGNNGADRVQGGSGNDIIVAHADSDILRGGTGNDTYRFDPSLVGNHVVAESPGEGTDQVSFAYSATFSLASTAVQPVSDKLKVRLTSGSVIENVQGGWGGNHLTGNALANRISGGSGSGSDEFTGGGGADTFVAGEGIGEYDPITEDVVPAWFGTDEITDFSEADSVFMFDNGVVESGLGTSTVQLRSQWDFGSMTATGHTFDAEDFS